MFWESRRDQWLLIGTQVGMGYDCLMDKIDLFEVELQTKVREDPLVGRGLLRDCEIFANLRLMLCFEDSDNGMWNKISDHVNFIHKVVRDYGEKICKNRDIRVVLERNPRRKLVGGG